MTVICKEYDIFYDRKELPNNLLILNVKMKIPHVIFFVMMHLKVIKKWVR